MFAIVGYGFVGHGTEYLLDVCGNIERVQIHDPDQGYEIKETDIHDVRALCMKFSLTPPSECNHLMLRKRRDQK